MHCDSSAERGIIHRTSCGRLLHIEARWPRVQEALRERRFLQKKNTVASHPVDIGTPRHSADRLDCLTPSVSMKIESFERPCLGAERLVAV